MSLHLRDVTRADLPALLSLRSRAFGPLGIGGDEWWERVAAETLDGRWLGVLDDEGDLVGAGRIRPYEQAWGGRHLQMGGVAGVYVEPSARGQGVATTLTRGLITRMGELGDVVSCLFPTTVSLYRRSGYEVGGVQQRTTYAGSTLRELGSLAAGRGLSGSLGSPGSPGSPGAFGSAGASGSPRASGSAGTSGSSGPSGLSEQPTLRPRRARPDDAEAIHRMLRDDAERHARSGPMPRGVEQLRGMIERDELITYVVPDGVVVYDLAADAVTVEHLVAGSSETAAALWGLVGSGSSAVPTVHTYLDPRDPLTLALGGLPAVEVRQAPWMARVIDLGAAFAGRGFAAARPRRRRARRRRPRGATQHRSLAALGGGRLGHGGQERRRPGRRPCRPGRIPVGCRRSGAGGPRRVCARPACSRAAHPTTTSPSTRSSPRPPTSPSTSDPRW